jgi:hypothetical protein
MNDFSSFCLFTLKIYIQDTLFRDSIAQYRIVRDREKSRSHLIVFKYRENECISHKTKEHRQKIYAISQVLHRLPAGHDFFFEVLDYSKKDEFVTKTP